MRASARLAILLLALLSRPARAQEEAPSDSTALITNHHGLYLFFLFIGVAPPLLLLLDRQAADTADGPIDFNYAAAYYSGGGFGSSELGGLVQWGGVQFLHNGVYGEYRLEKFGAATRLQFQTLRAGYLIRPSPQLVPAFAAGITVGYRHAQGPSVPRVVELGLPLLIRGNERPGGARFEPSYLFWRKGARFAYRFDMTFPLPPKPLAAGFTIEGKQIRPGTKYLTIVTLQLGLEL